MTKELITILLAMTPTIEAHGSITTAVGLFKFSIIKSFFLTSLGTTLIVAPLLFFWRFLAEYLMRRVYFLNRFLGWLFSYTRKRHAEHFERIDPEEKRAHFLKALALYVFVAIPGPLTGVWAGTVAAYVFGVPFRYAFLSIVLGAVSVALIDALIIGGFLNFVLN